MIFAGKLLASFPEGYKISVIAKRACLGDALSRLPRCELYGIMRKGLTYLFRCERSGRLSFLSFSMTA